MADRGQSHENAAGRDVSPATLAVWAGEGESLVQGATQVPIVYSAAYGYPDVGRWLDVALGRKPGHIYSRNTNPTVHAFEEKVRILEGAAAATSFSTGMAAISNTLFALLSPGDRVVSVKDTYGGTNQLFIDFLPRLKVEVELCETTDHEQVEAAIAKGCKVVYLETPTNPTLKVMDIARLAAAAHEVGADRGHRQHLRHADQPEPAGPRFGPCAPQRDQVPRRPRRRAGRRALRRPQARREGLPLP